MKKSMIITIALVIVIFAGAFIYTTNVSKNLEQEIASRGLVAIKVASINMRILSKTTKVVLTNGESFFVKRKYGDNSRSNFRRCSGEGKSIYLGQKGLICKSGLFNIEAISTFKQFKYIKDV